MTSPVERFRTALATEGSSKDFHNILVDWWDGAAMVWRPSILDGRADGFDSRFRSHADILFPESGQGFALFDSCETRSVRIGDLRPSRLVTDGIARFFATRYALEVLEDLQPCIAGTGTADRAQLDGVVRDLRRVYHETFALWRRAFQGGSANDSADGTVCHIADDLDIVRALDRRDLPAGAALEAFRYELVGGELSCAPVALWEESSRTWRPTILIGATGSPSQFMPSSRVRISVPDAPLSIREVCGADLKPLDIPTAGFSLCAIPVLVRDLIQAHRAMLSYGAGDADVQYDPMLTAIGEMLTGAIREWKAQFDLGLPGEAPEPRIKPLPPSLWGLVEEGVGHDAGIWWQQSPSRD